MASNDWRSAYLTAKLGGEDVHCRLPIEIETEAGLEIKRKGGIPVHKVKKAVYGLQRAGQDYAAHASSELGSIGFRSARDLIQQSPSQYLRAYDRAALSVLDVCNSTTVQTLMYCLFVPVFQARP